MLFRNARIYLFSEGEPPNLSALEAALSACEFRPCGAMDAESDGFAEVLPAPVAPAAIGAAMDSGAAASPVDVPGAMVLDVNDAVLLRHRHQQKILPATAVNELLDERAVQFENRTGRRPRARERRELRDDLRSELLPRALTRSTMTWLCIDLKSGWLAVDASVASRAERVLDSLREALGSLQVVPLAFNEPASGLLTQLLLGETSPLFTIGDQCRLTDPLHDVTDVRYRNADLTDANLRAQIRTGFKPTAAELIWRAQLSLVLDSEPCIQRLRDLASPEDDFDAGALVTDGSSSESTPAGGSADDPSGNLAGDFAYCHLTLRALLDDLATALGGLAVQTSDHAET